MGCLTRICTGPLHQQVRGTEVRSQQDIRYLQDEASWGDSPREDGPGSGVDLVVHHVLESLVVGGAQEDLGVHLPASVAGVHHLGGRC